MRKQNDRPEAGKIYSLTGNVNTPSIARGDSWKASEVKKRPFNNAIAKGLNECGRFYYFGDAATSVKA